VALDGERRMPSNWGGRSRGSELIREVTDEPLVDLDRRQRQAGFAGHILKREVVENKGHFISGRHF